MGRRIFRPLVRIPRSTAAVPPANSALSRWVCKMTGGGGVVDDDDDAERTFAAQKSAQSSLGARVLVLGMEGFGPSKSFVEGGEEHLSRLIKVVVVVVVLVSAISHKYHSLC